MNWSYYWDEIKSRKFYIFGFFLLVSLTSFSEWPLFGTIFTSAQESHVFPSNIELIIVFQKAAVIVIFAVSWDLLSGYSGQVSFGHALYLGLGAYLSILIKIGLTIGERVIFPGLENNYQEIFGIHIDTSIFIAIIRAALISAVFAFAIGIITIRMHGHYFALVTLVLPLMFQILVRKIWVDYTGGDGGLTTYGRAEIIQSPVNSEVGGLELFFLKIEHLYYVILVISIISILIMYLLARSRYGLVLRSIREDELAASASGINVNYYKLSVMVISGFFAAFAGGLYVQTLGSATGSIFEPERSFEVIIFTILGGIGTIAGSVIGTFILIFAISIYIEKGFVEIPTIEILIFALILIVVLKYQPRGLVNAKPQLRNALFFGVIVSILTASYDTGLLWPWMSERINPAVFLETNFGENEKGFVGINVLAVQGRMILYFILGTVAGFYGPEFLQKARLKIWGVWPNLGKFDTAK